MDERRRNAKKKPSLPTCMLYEVFSRVPAPMVEASLKNLSSEWRREIMDPVFIKDQLSHAKAGILIQSTPYPYEDIRHFTIEKGVFKLRRLEGALPMEGLIILASCDGISLVYAPVEGQLYAANIVMKRLRSIQLPENAFLILKLCSIGRVPATGEFKLLCPFVANGLLKWFVTTMGHDQQSGWREIDLNMDVLSGDPPSHHMDRVLISEVIYLAVTRGAQDHTVAAIDLSEESVHEIQVPDYFNSSHGALGHRWGRLVRMGDKVSFIAPDKETAYKINIYVLSDFRSSLWELLTRFIHPHVSLMYIQKKAQPIAWLDGEDILVCRAFKSNTKECRSISDPEGLVAFYVKTGKSRTVPVTELTRLHMVTNHTSSLLWF